MCGLWEGARLHKHVLNLTCLDILVFLTDLSDVFGLWEETRILQKTSQSHSEPKFNRFFQQHLTRLSSFLSFPVLNVLYLMYFFCFCSFWEEEATDCENMPRCIDADFPCKRRPNQYGVHRNEQFSEAWRFCWGHPFLIGRYNMMHYIYEKKMFGFRYL